MMGQNQTQIFSLAHRGRIFFFLAELGSINTMFLKTSFLLLHILKSRSPQTLSSSIFEKGSRLDILLMHECF